MSKRREGDEKLLAANFADVMRDASATRLKKYRVRQGREMQACRLPSGSICSREHLSEARTEGYCQGICQIFNHLCSTSGWGERAG